MKCRGITKEHYMFFFYHYTQMIPSVLSQIALSDLTFSAEQIIESDDLQ